MCSPLVIFQYQVSFSTMEVLFDDETPIDQNIHVGRDPVIEYVIEEGKFHLQAGMGELIKLQSEDSDMYIKSISHIIITPNDTTIYNHMPEIPDLVKHWWVIGSILKCNNQKVNKSSVVWVYYIQLTSSLWSNTIFNNTDTYAVNKMGDLKWITHDLITRRIVDVIMKAVKTHPRNYYACNSIRNFHELLGEPFLDEIQERLIELDDLSFWLAWVRCTSPPEKGLRWIKEEIIKGGLLSCMSSGKQVLSIYEKSSR